MMQQAQLLSAKQAWQFLVFFLFAYVLTAVSELLAQSPLAVPATPWSVEERQFWRKLQSPVSILRRDVPLREALDRFADSNQLDFFLDRRVDPLQPIDMDAHNVTIQQALEQLAHDHPFQISFVPPMVYVGPPTTVRLLATLVEQQRQRVAALPPSRRQLWLDATRLAWPRLTEPGPLIQRWAAARGIRLDGIDQIPHDLWAARQLPEMDHVLQLTLLLAGFETCPSVQRDGSARIVPLPADATLVRHYRLPASRRAQLQQFRATFSGQLQPTPHGLLLTGRTEDHRLFRQWFEGPTSRPPAATSLAQQRFTLTVKNQPLQRVLVSVARQLGRQLVWQLDDPAVKQHRISVQVSNAPLAQLMRGILAKLPLRYEIDARRLTIISVNR